MRTGEQVKLIYTRRVVEVYCNHKRIALHRRDYSSHRYTTVKPHLPSSHRFVSEWSPEKFTRWAATIGKSTEEYIKQVLEKGLDRLASENSKELKLPFHENIKGDYQ